VFLSSRVRTSSISEAPDNGVDDLSATSFFTSLVGDPVDDHPLLLSEGCNHSVLLPLSLETISNYGLYAQTGGGARPG